MAARIGGARPDLDAGLMRALGLAAVSIALVAVSGCSSEEPERPHAADASVSEASVSDVAKVGWSPCDALPAPTASRLVGARVAQDTGTPDAPRCAFTPRERGGAAYDVSYLWFDGGLDAALDAMGATGAQLERIEVPGADSARMVVRTQKSGVLVTGFVQTEGLVQSVNAVQVRPYDEAAVVAGSKALLGELVAHAPTSGGG